MQLNNKMQPDNDNQSHGFKSLPQTFRGKVFTALALVVSLLLWLMPIAGILRSMGLWFW